MESEPPTQPYSPILTLNLMLKKGILKVLGVMMVSEKRSLIF